MRERPILFSGPMVRAILDGRKTQTRRVVKSPGAAYPGYNAHADEHLRCPYGAPSDRLWVRESWQYADWTEDGQPFVRYAADGAVRFCEGAGEGETLVDTWATLSEHSNYSIDGKAADRRWRPSIHIPRWASRLTLELTDVRVERLQDISEADAVGEGVSASEAAVVFQAVDAATHRLVPELSGTARGAYAVLWDSLNADRGFGWDVNPWVWVLAFQRAKTRTAPEDSTTTPTTEQTPCA